jgi:NAD-dependent SIR2 family protein deacetylase
MTKIDPILPLAVQIAEGRGQFAFFLGSGVSRAAGIPSGWGVRQHTLKDLYRLQENIEKINEKAFEKWLEDTGFVNASYSSIIDALRPDKPQQREYLANFFAGKEPTEAHYALARLAKRDMVCVIITTNFHIPSNLVVNLSNLT